MIKMSQTQSSLSSFSNTQLFNVQGKVALITGGGTGIGLMAARALAANGAKVYIVGRRKTVLQRAIKETGPMNQLSGTLVAIEGDVTSKASLIAIRDAVKEDHLDILINNAGILGKPTTMGHDVESFDAERVAEMHLQNEEMADWDTVFHTNTHALFFATMTFLPLLHTSAQRKGDACIINITSVSGMSKHSQDHYAYNASKAAANHLTLMLAHELNYRSHLKIRINAIAPGLFPSDITTAFIAQAKRDKERGILPAKGREFMVDKTGTDEEMASAVLFLSCNTFVTGQVLIVDGGYTTATPSKL